MKKIAKKTLSAESIAKMADEGKSISRHFTNKGKMMGAIQRVNVDFTVDMLDELDKAAGNLNISRQAVIKTLVRLGLNNSVLSSKHKKTG